MKKLITKQYRRKLNKKKIICFILIPIVIIMALFSSGMRIMKQNQSIIENTELNNIVVAEQVEVIEESEPELPQKTTVYTTTSVNMRSAPGLHGEVIKVWKVNAELTKVGEINDWSIIETEDGEYYIKSTYLSTEKTKVAAERKTTVTNRGGSTLVAPSKNNSLIYLGNYKLTYYCSCAKCCGKSNGITASGKKVQEGITVACNSLPLGTKISINGHIYEVQDRGGMASNVIDVYVDSHQKALNLGVKYADVYKVIN